MIEGTARIAAGRIAVNGWARTELEEVVFFRAQDRKRRVNMFDLVTLEFKPKYLSRTGE